MATIFDGLNLGLLGNVVRSFIVDEANADEEASPWNVS